MRRRPILVAVAAEDERARAKYPNPNATLAARVAARNDLLEYGSIVVGQDGVWSLLEYLTQTVPQPLEVYLPGGDEEGTWCRIRLAPVRHPPDPFSAEADHVLA